MHVQHREPKNKRIAGRLVPTSLEQPRRSVNHGRYRPPRPDAYHRNDALKRKTYDHHRRGRLDSFAK
jgi:hypothetical protein